MSDLQLKNNAIALLSASILSTDLTIALVPGSGAKFPSLTGDQWFPATIVKASGLYEIVRVTARAGDVLTVLRGQETTLALAFGAGDRFELRLTAGTIAEELQRIEDIATGVTNSLRDDLSAPTGSELVKHLPAGIGAIAKSIRDIFLRKVSVSDYLPDDFDILTDDITPYFQKAVNYAADNINDWFGSPNYTTPRRVELETGCYKQLGTVYIPSGIVIDGNKSTLIGSGFTTSGNVMFETGYMFGGVAVSNVGTPNDANRVTDVQVSNLKITRCYIGFNLKNFNENCKLSNVVFDNCRISVKAFRAFYSAYENLFSRSDDPELKLIATEPSYWFISSVNAIAAYKVSTQGRKTAWLIDGFSGEGTRAMIMDGCSAEECEIGVQLLHAIEPLNIQNCYFEFCSIYGVDMYYAGVLNANIDNCWFGSCGTGIRADTILGGTIGDGNTFLDCTTNVDIASNVAAEITVEIPPAKIASNATVMRPSLPAGYALGRGVETQFPLLIYSANTGQPQVRQNYTGGLIDLPYSGEAGSVAGRVAYCDTSYSGGTVNYSAYIDTKIVFDSYMMLLFRFNTLDSNFNDIVQGRIFGTDVYYDRQDHGKTVVVSNVGGFVRLTIGVMNGAGGTAVVTGIVRHA